LFSGALSNKLTSIVTQKNPLKRVYEAGDPIVLSESLQKYRGIRAFTNYFKVRRNLATGWIWLQHRMARSTFPYRDQW